MENKKFKEWIEKHRDYEVTIDEYINNPGTIVLYNDDKYMLSRTDSAESTAIATVPTELCLAYPTDKSIGFENPIDEFLEHFFIYQIHLIENCTKMYETNDIGITVFKTKKEGKQDVRYWPPIQGFGDDLYYYDINECVIKQNLNKDYLNLPEELWKIFYNDIKKERGKK
tara:strand:- start:156 stop:665 length:510 start_codon:yes stop_codon:yes gene_type:complete